MHRIVTGIAPAAAAAGASGRGCARLGIVPALGYGVRTVRGERLVVVLLGVIFVVCIIVPAAAGLLIERARAGDGHDGPSGFSPFVWGAAARRRLGAVAGPIACVVAGGVVCTAVTLPLGFLAKHLQSAVDGPVFRWFGEHKSQNSFDKLNKTLTVSGDRGVTEIVVLVALIVLIFAYGRRWWVPVVVLAVVFVVQRNGQIELTSWIGRHEPPVPDSGGYPSGGVSRLVAVDGTIVALAAGLVPSLSRAWRIGLFTGVVTFGVVEGYTRVYLQVHWLTDALGGLVFGALVLALGAALVAALPPGRPLPERAGQPAARRTRDGQPGDNRRSTRPATSATP